MSNAPRRRRRCCWLAAGVSTLIVLAGCTPARAPTHYTSRPSPGATATPTPSAQTAASPTAQSGNTGTSFTYTFTREDSTGELSVATWAGFRGTGKAVTHPGSASAAIPAVPKTDVIVPFQISVYNPTSPPNDPIGIQYAVNGSGLGANNNECTALALDVDEWIHPRKSCTTSGQWKDTPEGFTGTVAGYVRVANYYSTTHPGGDPAQLKESGNPSQLLLDAHFDGSGYAWQAKLYLVRDGDRVVFTEAKPS